MISRLLDYLALRDLRRAVGRAVAVSTAARRAYDGLLESGAVADLRRAVLAADDLVYHLSGALAEVEDRPREPPSPTTAEARYLRHCISHELSDPIPSVGPRYALIESWRARLAEIEGEGRR